MTEPQATKLQSAIRLVVEKIRRFQGRILLEQNTKASLIEPVLEALGWDIRDPDEVFREFKPKPPDKPVDYCLNLLREARLLVEAKALGEALNDRKRINQIISYAAVAGVEWCVLTDGNEYRFYDATVLQDAEEKLFHHFKLSEEDDEEKAARDLNLISRSSMQKNILREFSKAHYVDRRVKRALMGMYEERDKRLIRLIQRKEPNLSPKEIIKSLSRMDVRVESVTPLPDSAEPVPPNQAGRAKKAQRRQKEGKIKYDVRLADIIAAALLSPPLRLFKMYRGTVMEATLLPDGSVKFDQERYRTCSTAAETARSKITGRKMNTNGWSFWQYLDAKGKTRTLADARTAFLQSKGG